MSFGRQSSKDKIQETTKNIKSSFTEGSNKIFGSVKKGFFDGISSTFDQVVNIVGSGDNEEVDNKPDSNKSNKNSNEESNKERQKSLDGGSKPRPPKPPAPMNRQKSDLGSNNSISKEPKNNQASRPMLKRRNTNPFMEDYEPNPAEADLPSTVVAEVYQMVSALYSNDDKKKNESKPNSKTDTPQKSIKSDKTSSKQTDEADSDGTEGCDEMNDLESDLAVDVGEDDQDAKEKWMGEIEVSKDAAAKECVQFMKEFVEKVFDSNVEITPTHKSKFCELSQKGFGRLSFSEYIKHRKTENETKIADETFYALIQFFTIVLFECNESEDFSPAKTLMDSCFIFYCETDPSKGPIQKQFLYSFLKDLPIWHSPKFWNAAFFFALQQERAAQSNLSDEDNKTNKISFKQLLCTTCCMRSLGLSKDQCLEFIKRQASTANLDQDQIKQLKAKMEKWVEGQTGEDEASGAMWFISQKAKAVNAAAKILKDGFNIRAAFKGEN